MLVHSRQINWEESSASCTGVRGGIRIHGNFYLDAIITELAYADKDGILAELRRREHYEKPSIKRKRKKAAKKRGAARGARFFRR